jgi:hypothetical protein
VGVVLSARKVTRRLVVSGKFFRKKALFGQESRQRKKKSWYFFMTACLCRFSDFVDSISIRVSLKVDKGRAATICGR